MLDKRPIFQKANPLQEKCTLDRIYPACHDQTVGRISVCHIIFKLDYGGLENGLVNLINHLPSNRYNHTIICLKNATDFRHRIVRPDVRVYEINKNDGKDVAVYWRVWRLLRQLRPDIVHTRNLPTIDMFLPSVLAGTKSLIHGEHGLDMNELDGHSWKYNQLRQFSNLFVTKYVSISHDLSSWLNQRIGIPEEKISLIYNGVDTDLFHPGPSNISLNEQMGSNFHELFVIGTIGRIQPVKGHIYLVQAFIRILEQRPDLRPRLRLAIIGDGSELQAIKDILNSHNALNNVWLPGFRNDTAELYRSFDLFALPSLREGISNTALEAMASGLPLVATHVGGNPEVVINNETGFLVPHQDSNALASALLRYIDNPALVYQHGRDGRIRAESIFSLESMVESYDQLYTDLYENKSKQNNIAL